MEFFLLEVCDTPCACSCMRLEHKIYLKKNYSESQPNIKVRETAARQAVNLSSSLAELS